METKSSGMLTPTEMAAHLGISERGAYRLIGSGTIPSVKVGRLRRVAQSDVQAYLDNH